MSREYLNNEVILIAPPGVDIDITEQRIHASPPAELRDGTISTENNLLYVSHHQHGQVGSSISANPFDAQLQSEQGSGSSWAESRYGAAFRTLLNASNCERQGSRFQSVLGGHTPSGREVLFGRHQGTVAP